MAGLVNQYKHFKLAQQLTIKTLQYYIQVQMKFIDKCKSLFGKLFYPPPEKDVFQETGELSPDEFTRAGNHLIQIDNGWQWRPSENPYFKCQYLDENKQYLVFDKALCRRRLNTSTVEEPKKSQTIEKSQQIEEGWTLKYQQDLIENYRYYKMYIIYDEYYHTPRMFFSATQESGEPISHDDIRLDIPREYLDKTLKVEYFYFLENVLMHTINPCKHATVLKAISDLMVQSGHQIGCHLALLIFLKIINGVIPYVEFDHTGDLVIG